METITSSRNPRVLAWRSLRDKKGRADQDAFLVEGTKMVREALSSGFDVLAVLLREDTVPSFDLPASVSVFQLPDHVFQSVCDTKTPQGIAAVLSRRVLPLAGTRFLALDGIQDPGNMGTMIRTADAAGFDGLLLSPFYERKDVSSFFVLIVGNEGNGISDPVRAEATHRLRLPMRGGAESLNAAVAAGIMMYDLMKNA